MALQSSGAISLLNVQTEFGGANPISISEYYGVDAGVPGSGTISLSDFYGKSSFDVTPTWTNWGEPDLGPGNDNSSTATFSNFNQTITLRFSAVMSDVGLFSIYKNGIFQSPNLTSGGTRDISIVSGDNLYVGFQDYNTTGVAGFGGTLEVINITDGSAAIKTWSISAFGGGGGVSL